MYQEQDHKTFTQILTHNDYGKRFQTIQELGAGQSAVVYLCYDNQNNRYVANKFYRKELMKYFPIFAHREAQNEDLCHPNLMKIYQAFIVESNHSQKYVLVSEYCELGDLSMNLEKLNNLGEIEMFQLTLGIVKGLDQMHKNKKMHRDLKPDNIYLKKGENQKIIAKIGDFGLSKSESIQNTVCIGTRIYADPETLSENYTKSCDIYSLGVVIFEIFTGRKLFLEMLEQLPENNHSFFERKKQNQVLILLQRHFSEINISAFIKTIISLCFFKSQERISALGLISMFEEQIQKIKKEKQEEIKMYSIISQDILQNQQSIQENPEVLNSSLKKKTTSTTESHFSQISLESGKISENLRISQIIEKKKCFMNKKGEQKFFQSESQQHQSEIKENRINSKHEESQNTHNQRSKKRSENKVQILDESREISIMQKLKLYSSKQSIDEEFQRTQCLKNHPKNLKKFSLGLIKGIKQLQKIIQDPYNQKALTYIALIINYEGAKQKTQKISKLNEKIQNKMMDQLNWIKQYIQRIGKWMENNLWNIKKSIKDKKVIEFIEDGDIQTNSRVFQHLQKYFIQQVNAFYPSQCVKELMTPLI